MARQGSPGKSAESFGKTIAGQPGILHTLFSPDWRIFSKEMKTHSGCIVVVSGSVHFTLTLRQSVLNLAGLKPAHWIALAAVWNSMQSSLDYRHIGTRK